MTDNDSEDGFEHHSDLDLLEDRELLDLVRNDNGEAFAVLFDRYRHAAHRLARYLSNSVDAKDIVSESFTQVFHQLREGRGPDSSFRGYLFTSIRREAGRRAKAAKRVMPTDDITRIDRPVPFGDGEYDRFERDIARSAYESLPQRWRLVLWHLDVEGRKPHELAPALGLQPNSVSALAYRAREGLRKAYLEQHAAVPDEVLGSICHEIRPQIAGFVRETATDRETLLIQAHLDSCVTCMGAYLELKEVNLQLGSVTALVAAGAATSAAPGALGAFVANAAVAAKSALVTIGSAAAVMATSVAVLEVPLHTPAAAEQVHQQTVQLSPHQEPDRSNGPAADRGEEPLGTSDERSDASSTGEAGEQGQVENGPPNQGSGSGSSGQSGSSGSGPASLPVSIDRKESKVTVGLGGVKASVDLRDPVKSTASLPKVKSVVQKSVVVKSVVKSSGLLNGGDDCDKD